MCLAIPGKIVEWIPEKPLPMAKVSFAGVVKEICLAYVPDAKINDYVLVHVGFAISKIDEEAALKTLAYLENEGDT